jgi:hypothetical protein
VLRAVWLFDMSMGYLIIACEVPASAHEPVCCDIRVNIGIVRNAILFTLSTFQQFYLKDTEFSNAVFQLIICYAGYLFNFE